MTACLMAFSVLPPCESGWRSVQIGGRWSHKGVLGGEDSLQSGDHSPSCSCPGPSDCTGLQSVFVGGSCLPMEYFLALRARYPNVTSAPNESEDVFKKHVSLTLAIWIIETEHPGSWDFHQKSQTERRRLLTPGMS